MQFNLPENLKNSIVAYDPELRKVEIERKREQRTRTASDKPKNSLGLPIDLIPENVVSKENLLEDLEYINTRTVVDRFVVRPTYFIYYYDSVWCAIWFCPENQVNEKYLYGYSFCFRNTEKLRKNKESLLDLSSQVIKYKRSEFILTITYETLSNILKRKDKRSYIEHYTNFSYKRGNKIEKAYNNFSTRLTEQFDKWPNSTRYQTFDKIRDRASYAHLLLDSTEYSCNPSTDTSNIDFYSWKPSFEGITNFLKTRNYTDNAKIIQILSKPFFKKKLENVKGDIENLLFSMDDKIERSAVKKVWSRVLRLVSNIQFIEQIWPNCPIDYYQTHFDILEKISRFAWSSSDKANAWLHCNMPVATFFNFLGKYSEHNLETQDVVSYQLWQDSYSMLRDITNKTENKLAQPKRWRLQEFHDYLQEESWKLNTTNESLPQDLFPTPVTVAGQEKWTFFQPKDVHQLSSWGQAVRNCVGAASSYADGVKKKQHFIVLAMINNAPTFTVQLKVDNGTMSVTQIVNVCNKRLTEDEKENYTTMFGAALEQRNEELAK